MSTGSSTPRLRVGAWAALLVVAGLLAMHGVGTHGSTAEEHASMGAVPGHHAAEHLGAGMVAEAVAALAPAAPAPGAHHVRTACVAVLALALLLLLGILPLGSARRTPSTPAHLVRLLRRARAPDPPDLVRLCVCRC
jgi:hypothetical protein